MAALRIKTPSAVYPVHLTTAPAAEALPAAFSKLRRKHSNTFLTLITDRRLKRHYAPVLRQFAKEKNCRVFSVVDGERAKSIEEKMRIEKFLFETRHDRSSCLVAFGGGVVGDLVGYVAATYMRGIAFYAFPTTLVSVADSSVGGKTGINTPFGKNLIGAYHHPKAVFVLLSLLKTLPEREYRSGMAEVVKYGFIKKRSLLAFIEKTLEKINARELSTLETLARESIAIKKAVVALDEREGGYRRILNFGHTVGHALELLAEYQLKHGEAVAMGMALEAYLSMRLGHLKQSEFERAITLLKKLRLPVKLPAGSSPAQLYQAMLLDKKASGGAVCFNALARLGTVAAFSKRFVTPLSRPVFLKLTSEYLTHF